MKSSVLIIFVISGLLLAGCSGETPPEEITISMLFNEREDVPYSDDWLILQEYLERKGIIFETTIGDNDNYEEDLFQAIESETPPHIILKVWPGQITSYIGSELIVPISDYTERMPWFSAYIKDNDLGRELDRIRMSDGKYYVLPGFQREIQVQQWVFRKDLFQKTPTTYEELFEELIRLKEVYPESTPITACWGGAHLYSMMAAGFGITGGWAGYRSYNEDSGEWEFSPATGAYREMHRFLHRCYAADLFDLEEFNQSAADFSERLSTNKSFFAPTWVSSGLDPWDFALHDRGIDKGDWEPLPVLQSSVGLRALPPVDRYRKGLIITTAAMEHPYFEELLEFLDWAVYSPEGRELTTWGVEGVTFEQKAQGKTYLPEIISSHSPAGRLSPERDFGLRQLFDLVEDEEFEDSKRPEPIVSFLANSLRDGDTLPLDPNLSLSPLEQNAVNKIQEQINSYASKTAPLFITGELDIERDWDGYITELERLGYRTLEKLWNEAAGKS